MNKYVQKKTPHNIHTNTQKGDEQRTDKVMVGM
jgi:hypothetical protein